MSMPMMTLMLVLLSCSGGAGARVRLNSIRTVILRDGGAMAGNRSSWEPNLDLTLYQCMSDLECSEGSYCHAPSRGPAHSRCLRCRRKKRRCHRDGMCCPGNRCSNNVCSAETEIFLPQKIWESSPNKRGWKRNPEIKDVGAKGQVGDPCLRASDCSDGLCCARHFWTRICKPVLQEGQVCTRHRRKGNHGPELFQRCPCGDALSCRTLPEPRAPASSSSLLAAAAKSKFASSSSSSATSHRRASAQSTAVAKTRLHVCQKN